MTGKERRIEIINAVKNAKSPLSGSALAKEYNVSRQVIVQDIALLRASGYDIISMNRGYLLQQREVVKKVICTAHKDSEIEDELNTIVDMGGCIIDVFVEHDVYGELRAPLFIRSRRNVREFVEQITSGEASPLKNLTAGIHFHTIETENEQVFDLIEKDLLKKGYLIKNKLLFTAD